MSEYDTDSNDSELSDEDLELQTAFAEGHIKPGLSKVVPAPRQYANNIKGLQHRCEEMKLNLPWIETLDSINKEAPLAPEIAAKMMEQEQKRANEMKNNKKLPQYTIAEDPVLNDFKREMMFHRQAQAAVMQALPRLKAMGIPTIRPDDYFAEMAKTDNQMQKIRQSLMQKQAQQQRSERVKQLRQQRKEGKAIHTQTRLARQKERKDMMDQVKKVRKGVSNDLSFLDGGKKGAGGPSRKAIEKRKMKDKKFGFGGKKKGMKTNTKESAADISDYQRPKRDTAKGGKFGRNVKGGKGKKPGAASKRPGKNRRAQNKTKGRK